MRDSRFHATPRASDQTSIVLVDRFERSVIRLFIEEPMIYRATRFRRAYNLSTRVHASFPLRDRAIGLDSDA